MTDTILNLHRRMMERRSPPSRLPPVTVKNPSVTIMLLPGSPHSPTNPQTGFRSFDLGEESENGTLMQIGRSSDNPEKDIIPRNDNGWFDSRVMSRNHAKIGLDADKRRVYIEDLGSMHGTYLNGVRITSHQRTTLSSCDTLRFGAEVSRGQDKYQPTQMIFDMEWAPAKTLPCSPTFSPHECPFSPVSESPTPQALESIPPAMGMQARGYSAPDLDDDDEDNEDDDEASETEVVHDSFNKRGYAYPESSDASSELGEDDQLETSPFSSVHKAGEEEDEADKSDIELAHTDADLEHDDEAEDSVKKHEGSEMGGSQGNPIDLEQLNPGPHPCSSGSKEHLKDISEDDETDEEANLVEELQQVQNDDPYQVSKEHPKTVGDGSQSHGISSLAPFSYSDFESSDTSSEASHEDIATADEVFQDGHVGEIDEALNISSEVSDVESSDSEAYEHDPWSNLQVEDKPNLDRQITDERLPGVFSPLATQLPEPLRSDSPLRKTAYHEQNQVFSYPSWHGPSYFVDATPAVHQSSHSVRQDVYQERVSIAAMTRAASPSEVAMVKSSPFSSFSQPFCEGQRDGSYDNSELKKAFTAATKAFATATGTEALHPNQQSSYTTGPFASPTALAGHPVVDASPRFNDRFGSQISEVSETQNRPLKFHQPSKPIEPQMPSLECTSALRSAQPVDPVLDNPMKAPSSNSSGLKRKADEMSLDEAEKPLMASGRVSSTSAEVQVDGHSSFVPKVVDFLNASETVTPAGALAEQADRPMKRARTSGFRKAAAKYMATLAAGGGLVLGALAILPEGFFDPDMA